MNKKHSQNLLILNHCRYGGVITPLEALNLYDCMRLGARIYEIEHWGLGYKFNHKMIKQNGKHFMSYELI